MTIPSKHEVASEGGNAFSCSVGHVCPFFEFSCLIPLVNSSLISLAYIENEIIAHKIGLHGQQLNVRISGRKALVHHSEGKGG